ncbi:MAG: RNA polymerase sigma factor [Cyclobacteriaceae bacterium]|nr:RNA polymerase sigma factor [Cyclobacteriaceae bacterium]
MQFQIYRARETELIEGCRRKDRASQKALYERFAPKMLGVCCRYIKDRMEAEDVLVTTFMKVFDRLDQFKGDGSFEGWVRKIAVNESLTYLRKNKNMYLETDLETAHGEMDVTAISHELEAVDLQKLIASLPTGYRVVFNLYAIDGFSHKEIAEQIGISESTSKSQLSRARSHLQAKLAQMEKSMYAKVNVQ